MTDKSLGESNSVFEIQGNDSSSSKANVYDLAGQQFSTLSKLITRDLNNYRQGTFFKRYTKDDISRFLGDPNQYEENLRQAVLYIYGASSHFMRLIQYFTGLTDFAYIISPYRIDPKKASARIVNNNYRRVLNLVGSLNMATQLRDILTVCFREDVFYGTFHITDESIIIQQLPSEYCAISSVEDNVPNVTFNFSYFDSREDLLQFYPTEFKRKYDQYRHNTDRKKRVKWIELDSPTSFAVKIASDILSYAIPPFAGLLREIYDIEDYKQLKLAKTALENYAMLAMKLPMLDDGSWGIDLPKAREFWENLSGVLPPEIGSVLTPMDINKISFEKSNTGDTETVSNAEQNLYSAAGVSSLLFNNEKASANALLLSIKADQSVTFKVVKHIEDVLNRLIHSYPYGKNFKLTFLDCSPFNRKEMGDAYLKAASFGIPTISAYAASQGVSQAELDSMSYLEGTVLELPEMFTPLRSSSQMSSKEVIDGNGATDEGGAPVKGVGDITESGENNQENA